MKMRIDKIRTKTSEWIEIQNISRDEGNFLRERYGFHHLDIQDCFSIQQNPKIDLYEDYIFMIFSFPSAYKKNEGKIEILELDVFITEGALVTVHRGGLMPVESLFENCKNNVQLRNKFMGKNSSFLLYRMLNILAKGMFAVIENIQEELNKVERDIYEEQTKDVAMELANIRRNVLTIKRFITPQKLVLQTLIHSNKKSLLGSDVEVYFGDILDKFDRASVILENFHDLIKGFNETNEAIMSHKTTQIMRILTIISVTIMPLTLLSGIYGMNVEALPWAKHPLAFWAVMIMMGALLSIILLIFRRKKWI